MVKTSKSGGNFGAIKSKQAVNQISTRVESVEIDLKCISSSSSQKNNCLFTKRKLLKNVEREEKESFLEHTLGKKESFDSIVNSEYKLIFP